HRGRGRLFRLQRLELLFQLLGFLRKGDHLRVHRGRRRRRRRRGRGRAASLEDEGGAHGRDEQDGGQAADERQLAARLVALVEGETGRGLAGGDRLRRVYGRMPRTGGAGRRRLRTAGTCVRRGGVLGRGRHQGQ